MSRIAPLLVATLTACGGLGSPDLTTGEVRGRIVGAVGGMEGGYVYPLGRPELKAHLAADGSFRVKLPAGAAELVLYDGKPSQAAPYGSAKRLVVQVEGAEIADVGEQSELPPAGAILAGVRPESGARCKDLRFLVELVGTAGNATTDQDRVIASGLPAVLLNPLPAGRYQLRISMQGFRSAVQDVDLTAATWASYELPLYVDDDEDRRGCQVTGCGSSDLTCGDGGRCVPSSGTGSGSCGNACTSDGGDPCQAGLTCADAGAGLACQPAAGATCSQYLGDLGAMCLSDDACKVAVVNGVCEGADGHHAGYCTASCQGDADCAGFPAGWRCDSDRHVCRPVE